MIDVENFVIDRVNQRIKAEGLTVHVHSGHVRSPSEFPALMLYESDNTTYEAIRFDGRESFAEVRYTAEVCTNETTGKKELAKQIMTVVDNAMQEMGFYRDSKQYTFGTNESSVFVALSTYRGLVGESPSGDENDYTVYRR